MIKVHVNGEPVDLNACLLSEVLNEIRLGEAPFAIAVNEQFIPKCAYAATKLSDGDAIELVSPMQGG